MAQARAAWEGMPAMPEAWAAELERRFAEACRAAEKRFERRQLAKQSAERLPTLVPEIEALAENPSYNDIRSQWYSLRKQWQAIARDVEIDAELRARYDAAAQKLEAQEQTHRDAKGAAAGREPAAAAGAGAEIRNARHPPKASRSSRPIS